MIKTLSIKLAGNKSNLILFVNGSNVGIIEPFTAVFTYLSPIPRTVIKPPFVETPDTRDTAATTLASPVFFIVSEEM